MNPNRGENPVFEAPSEPSQNTESFNGSTNERGVSSPESNASKKTSDPALPIDPSSITFTPAPVIPGDDPIAPQQIATISDINPDRIEKEWVDKAKSIVAQTKDDPYTQKAQMSKIKAEYIKGRFNKVLKTQ